MIAPDKALEAISCTEPSDVAGAAPIDLDHLHRQTMGDRALEAEILQIFVEQAHACLRGMAAGEEAAAHLLKGAAGGVGAFRVATIAGALERTPGDTALLALLASAVAEAENFISGLCR